MMSLTYDEILEQPGALRRLIDEEAPRARVIAAALYEADPAYLMLVARGTSDNAARYGQYCFAAINGLATALAIPSAYTVYGHPPKLRDCAVIGVSQSGQSPDIVAVMTEGRRQGALTIAMTNTDGSPLEFAAEQRLPLRAGVEKSVAATKSYTASLAAMAMLSAALTDDATRWAELASVPDAIANVCARAETTIRAAERYTHIDKCVVASRGFNYATAFEVALKIKEMTYVIAEPFSSADFVHGPVAVVESGFPVIVVVPEGAMAGELIDLLKVLNERGADLVVISALEEALALAKTPLPLPMGIPEWLSPIVAVVQGQLFAYGLTLAKGYDPDRPRGLHKVTLTR